MNKKRVGVVGDLHLPFAHPMYLRFVQDLFDSWGVNHIHFVGDIVDSHALSFWEHDPNGMSAEDEAARASIYLDEWKSVFPKATVCIGNHDARHYRVARKAGLPERFLRTYAEVWDTPQWKWKDSHVHDGVLYEHGTGSSGKDAAYNRALQNRCSLVMGHVHSYGGVKWHANDFNAIFGMNAGCGLDCRAYAMAYSKPFVIRPTLGAGIVIDGAYPYFEPMQIGRGQPYHRSRA